MTPPDVWTAELSTLRNALDAAAAEETVIVSGDFNTTFTHKQFRDLLDVGYSDAADQLGVGIVRTIRRTRNFPRSSASTMYFCGADRRSHSSGSTSKVPITSA